MRGGFMNTYKPPSLSLQPSVSTIYLLNHLSPHLSASSSIGLLIYLFPRPFISSTISFFNHLLPQPLICGYCQYCDISTHSSAVQLIAKRSYTRSWIYTSCAWISLASDGEIICLSRQDITSTCHNNIFCWLSNRDDDTSWIRALQYCAGITYR